MGLLVFRSTILLIEVKKRMKNPEHSICVDFHNSDRQGRVRLNCVGTIQDLNRLGVQLREGMSLHIHCEELEASATTTYSLEEGIWVACLNTEITTIQGR